MSGTEVEELYRILICRQQDPGLRESFHPVGIAVLMGFQIAVRGEFHLEAGLVMGQADCILSAREAIQCHYGLTQRRFPLGRSHNLLVDPKTGEENRRFMAVPAYGLRIEYHEAVGTSKKQGI